MATSENTFKDAEEAATDARSWWDEEWSKFPTCKLDEDGTPNFWAVGEDSGIYADDWKTGQGLARDTVAQMQNFPEGSTALRRILSVMDFNSNVGQGFLTRIEDMLTRPEIYLDDLEHGAVQAKLRGETE